MNRASVSTIIFYSIQYLGTIALILCSTIFLNSSGELSAIFAGAAHILYGLAQSFRVRDKGSLVDKPSLTISEFGAVVLVLGIITYCVVIINDTIDGIIGFVMKCISGIFILIIVAVQSFISYSKHYSISKSARNLINSAYGLIFLLIIGGAALTIFLQSFINALGYSFNFYILSIVGCAIWFAVTIYTIYLMATHEYDDSVDRAEGAVFKYLFK